MSSENNIKEMGWSNIHQAVVVLLKYIVVFSQCSSQMGKVS